MVGQIYVYLTCIFAGNACQYKVVGCLKKQFKTPRDAEDAYIYVYSGKQRSDGDSIAMVEPIDVEGDSSGEQRSDNIATVEPSGVELQFSQLSSPVNNNSVGSLVKAVLIICFQRIEIVCAQQFCCSSSKGHGAVEG